MTGPESDLIFGIGCSFTETNFGVKMPAGARIIHATLDPGDINKDVPVALGIAGDAKIVLDAMLAEVRKLHGGKKKDAKKAAKAAKRAQKCLPKVECCISKDRCKRCPIRMLKEGTLPEGLTVKKRVLVTTDGKKVSKKKLAKAA